MYVFFRTYNCLVSVPVCCLMGFMGVVRLRTVSGGGSVTFTVPPTQSLVLFGVAPVNSRFQISVS